MEIFIKWLKSKNLSEEKIQSIIENLNDFHNFLRANGLILCEATDEIIVKWIKSKTNNKNSYYNYFELLSYSVEFYKENRVKINFKLTNIYLYLKHKKFRKSMYRLHIDNLLDQFKQQYIDYEFKYRFNETNIGLDFIINNNKNVKVAYADFNEDECEFQFSERFIENGDFDTLLILCIFNEAIKKYLIVPRESLDKFKYGGMYSINLEDAYVRKFDDDWSSLKTI